MTKRRKCFSLQTKFILMLLAALTAGFGLGGVTKLTGEEVISTVYMSDAATERRCREVLDSFADYVETEELSVRQARDITMWAKHQNHVYLLVSDGEKVLVDSGWWDEKEYYSAFEERDSFEESAPVQEDGAIDESDVLPAAALEPAMEEEEDQAESESVVESFTFGMGTAPVEFSDGIYMVSVYDFSEEPLYDAVTVGSYAVTIAVFMLVMLTYHQRVIKQIIRLSREVEEIARGSLEGEITVRNRDEISVLAEHVDVMRTSIIKEMRAEQEAWNANSDLITRMSHDIRTPLTVLLGFLELLDEGGYSGDETYQSYLGICKKNAFQLKELADKLFQYFLVFGHDACEMELEVADAQMLLEQLIGEHEVLLQEQGWNVEDQKLEQPVLIEVDMVYLKRLFDNLFSNIEKYADQSCPVIVRQQKERSQIRITLENQIRPDPNPVESTNIGLKTCERIVEQMGGAFHWEKADDRFRAELILPLYMDHK